MHHDYPIQNFIETRRTELGLRRSELARRCGYKKISKGLRPRSLDEIHAAIGFEPSARACSKPSRPILRRKALECA